MPGIPPDLLYRLRITLIQCGPFNNDQALHAVFVDSRVAAWRYRLRETASVDDRVDALIDGLYYQFNPMDENALVQFLRVLSECISEADACRNSLTNLAQELEQETQNQPIPPAFARQVLTESGHRCAACGKTLSLETAQIVPWRATHDYTLENLVALCPSCRGD